MLLGDVRIKTMRDAVKIVFADAAYETVGLHVIDDALQLTTKLSESINDQTWDREMCFLSTNSRAYNTMDSTGTR